MNKCPHKSNVTVPKRVIFIGSCSYSGSTILDLILGSVDGAASMGEVGRIYLPRRKEHFDRECGCLKEGCTHWDSVLEGGMKNIHTRAFEEFKVSTLVDSTKDPFWIRERGLELERIGVEVINLLIWKTPSEIMASFAKRGIRRAWRRSWQNYHLLYFSLIREFHPIPFGSLLRGGSDFIMRLNDAGIHRYNLEYWNSPGHTLFGNDSAKRHLHEEGTREFLEIQKRRAQRIGDKETGFSFREIKTDEVRPVAKENGKVKDIKDFLLNYDNLDNLEREEYQRRVSFYFGGLSSAVRKYFEISKSFLPYLKWKLSIKIE